MIIFLDVENKNFLLYKDDGLLTIPFNNAKLLSNYIEKTVLYVTKAEEVDVNDIINFVENDLNIQQNEKIEDIPINNNKYLHSKIKGTLYIYEDFKFVNEFDCKLLDEDMVKLIKNIPVFPNLIKTGKVEIINETQKNEVLKKYKEYCDKMGTKQKAIDKRLDSIILNQKVEDWDGNDNDTDTEHDAISVDIDSGGGIKIGNKSYNTMNEMLNDIEGE